MKPTLGGKLSCLRRIPPAGGLLTTEFNTYMEVRSLSARTQSQSQVLIVDGSAESREVLRTALARRGVRILEASQAGEGLRLARQHRPEVIVLDLEAAAISREEAGNFADMAELDGGNLLVLGTAASRRTAVAGEFVAKPYHYAPLILKIETLLQSRQLRAAA